MNIFESLYREESARGERTACRFRWIMIAFLLVMAVVQISDSSQRRVGISAAFVLAAATLYNLVLGIILRRPGRPGWVAWVSVSVDVLLVSSTIYLTTRLLHPSGAATTAIVLLYPVVILVASFRHNPRLVIYAALLSVGCFNAIYWATASRIPTELYDYAPLVRPSGQFFKSMYLLLFGGVLLALPRTIDRLLRSQQAAFDRATNNYEAMAGRLGQDLAVFREQGTALAGETRAASRALGEIVAMMGDSRRRADEQTAVVKDVAGLLASLDSFASRLEAAVADQGGAIRETAAATEEMIGNIDSLSRSAQDTKAQAERLAERSEEGRTGLDEVLASIELVSEKSSGMLDAVSVISGIAETTNLLAMNAAIEAAHAGEAGRGFSVVADEIRKLAEETATQSTEIAAELVAVKESIDEAVVSSGRAGASFSSVVEGVRAVASRMAEMEAAMREQAAGSQQIAAAMGGMHEATARVREGAVELRTKSAALAGASTSLSAAAAGIREDVAGSAAKLGAVEDSIRLVGRLGEESGALAERIGSSLEAFSVVEEAEEA